MPTWRRPSTPANDVAVAGTGLASAGLQLRGASGVSQEGGEGLTELFHPPLEGEGKQERQRSRDFLLDHPPNYRFLSSLPARISRQMTVG